jgi:hypothetical protein
MVALDQPLMNAHRCMQVARVAVEALVLKEASNKIVEVIESADAPKKSLDELFAACKNAS